MQVANQANLSSKGGANLGGLAGLTGAAAALSDVSTDFKVVLAGAILTLIFSFLLIIYWGLTDHGAQGLSLRKSTEASGPGLAGAPQRGGEASAPLPGRQAPRPGRRRARRQRPSRVSPGPAPARAARLAG